jgi:hypothetical protein
MRMIFLLAAILGAAVVSTTEAKAQYFPWCATYSVKGGGESCSFVSFAQCRANVSGIGGFCYQNPWYYAYVAPRSQDRLYRRKKYVR